MTDYLLVWNPRTRGVAFKKVHAALAQENGDLSTIVAQYQLIGGGGRKSLTTSSRPRASPGVPIVLQKPLLPRANSRRRKS